MNVFDKEKTARLEQQNKSAVAALALSLVAAGLLCAGSVLFVDIFGRIACQGLATASTAVCGCLWFAKLQAIRQRKRILVLCRKIPGPAVTGLVRSAESQSTTLGRLSFYALELDVEGKRKSFYLYHEVDPALYVGKKLTLCAWEHIILSLEVAV